MVTHTHAHTHTYIHTHTHTHTHTTTSLCACEPRVNEALKCIQLIYSINVLSKYSSLISHRPSIFEGRHIDHRSSKVNTSISEGRHIDLRRSTHRDIDLRKAIHRSSKVATSIFKSRHIYFRRSKGETSHLQFATEYCPQLPSKSLE